MMQEKIKNILIHWGLTNIDLLQQYKVGGDRIVCKVDTNLGIIILKGYPINLSEKIMLDIIHAHDFLSSKNHMAPNIYYCSNGSAFWKDDKHYYYAMEFIYGRNAGDTVKDWFLLGEATARLHNLTGYDEPCSFDVNDDIRLFKDWYSEKSWKFEFDAFVDSLPDFNKYNQCLIHSDIGPANSIICDDDSVVFIDLDGMGIGSQFIDLGWPFITHFVYYNNQTEKMDYKLYLAKAFLEGYCYRRKLTPLDYDLMWKGAIYSHIFNMQWFGKEAADFMWEKLKFGLNQKGNILEHVKCIV